MSAEPTIHPTATVSRNATIGPGTRIWHQAHVREGAHIGAECVIGKNAYVDVDVVVGDRVKIQNNASLFHGVTVEDGAFIGPHACLTNDRQPRAVNVDGSPKSEADWTVSPILVRAGASVGAGAVVVAGVTIGRWAMVGAGSVVTHDVGDHELVLGNPARRRSSVCSCGQPLADAADGSPFTGSCPGCGRAFPPQSDQ